MKVLGREDCSDILYFELKLLKLINQIYNTASQSNLTIILYSKHVFTLFLLALRIY